MATTRWPRRCSLGTREMRRRGAPSLVLALALGLSGCAGAIGGKEPVPTVETPRPPASGTSVNLGAGSLTVVKGRPGYVIGAPHGTTDSATDAIGLDLARRTGFGSAVATGFGKLDADGRRYNVNRPTESVAGAPPGSERETEAARRVFEAYGRSVTEASQGPLRLYVEVHGNAHQDTAGCVEIATVGLSKEDDGEDAPRAHPRCLSPRPARDPASGDLRGARGHSSL